MFVGATRKKKLPSVHSVLALSGHTNKIEKMHTFDLLQNLPGKRESRVNNILFGIFLLGFGFCEFINQHAATWIIYCFIWRILFRINFYKQKIRFECGRFIALFESDLEN